MTFGILEYQLPGEQPVRFALEKPSVSLGRSPGNNVVLDHDTIERRHARLTLVNGQPFIEDLGTTGGTYINRNRIESGEPFPLRAGDFFWLGQVKLAYSASPNAASPFDAVAAQPSQGTGQATRRIAKIQDAAPDEPPAQPRQTGPLPSQSQQAPTAVPPGLREAGSFDTLSQGEAAQPQAYSPPTPSAGPPPSLHMSLQPYRGKGSFTVEMQHTGPNAAAYQLSASDPEETLNYRFEHRKLRLQPGQWVTVPLFVTTRDKSTFSARTFPFVVLATPLDANGRPAQTEAELVSRPALPLWWLPLLLVLFACGAVSAGLLYLNSCGGFNTNAPFCPAPVVHVFEVEPPIAAPGDTVAVSWDVSGAHTVLLEPGVGEVEPFAILTLNPVESTRYTLTAIGGGGTVTREVEVQVATLEPLIESFSAEPATLVRGRDSQLVLSWSVLGVESVTISPLTGSFPATGQQVIAAPSQSTTFVLDGANEFGAVSQELVVSVSDAVCTASADTAMYVGPDANFEQLAVLPANGEIAPLDRTADNVWLRGQAVGIEGWVQAAAVSCQVDITTLPVAAPDLLPTATAAPTATPVPIPTGEPIDGGGVLSYRQQTDDGVSYVAIQGADTTVLVENADDVELLDYTTARGGVFALLVTEEGVQTLHLVRPSGAVIAAGLNPGWAAVTDGDFAPDGQRLVIEAVDSGTAYFVFDAQSGALLNEPNFP